MIRISDVIAQLENIKLEYGDLPMGIEIYTDRKINGNKFNHVDIISIYTSVAGTYYPLRSSDYINGQERICHIACSFNKKKKNV